MSKIIVLAAVLLIAAIPCSGEIPECPAETTKIARCVETLRENLKETAPLARPGSEAILKALTDEKLEGAKDEKTTTGPDAFASRLASTLTDFLDVFAGAFEVDSLSEDGRTLTLNWAPSQLEKQPFRVQSVVRKPEVFDKLKEAIPEAGRDERVAKLEKNLDDLDDVEFVASYRLNQKATRYLADYDATFREVVRLAADKLAVAAKAADDVHTIEQQIATAFPELEDAEIELAAARNLLGAERYLDLEQQIRNAAAAQKTWSTSVTTAVEQTFEPFAKAVNNRSQWLATASYRLRDDAVGPVSWKASFRYEHGFLGNPETLKTILTGCGNDPTKCGAEIDRWNRHAGKHRLVITADYEEVNDYRDPLSDVDLSLDGSHSWTVTAAYGLYLDQAAKKRRLDFSFGWENVSSDPTRKDRMVASVAVTNLVSKNLSVPIGIVYANHEKFLGEVDEKWSAHFGLNYSFDFAKK